jgi:hypothetical protein
MFFISIESSPGTCTDWSADVADCIILLYAYSEGVIISSSETGMEQIKEQI